MEAKKEEFIITREWLEEMGALESGLQNFKKHFPNGGEALEVLKRCEELNLGLGSWLVDFLPPIYPPLELNDLIGDLFYPNDVHIKGDLSTQGLIYIKGNLKVDGKLTVNKYGNIYSDKGCVNADEIYISGDASIHHTQIKANSIIISGYAVIVGDTKAKVINFKGGHINGDVDANEIINDGGLIVGDVKTIRIENIKDGQINGDVDADEIINDSGVIQRDVKTIKIENINGGQIWGDVDADEIINEGEIEGDVNTIKIECINSGEVYGKITYKHSDEHK